MAGVTHSAARACFAILEERPIVDLGVAVEVAEWALEEEDDPRMRDLAGRGDRMLVLCDRMRDELWERCSEAGLRDLAHACTLPPGFHRPPAGARIH